MIEFALGKMSRDDTLEWQKGLKFRAFFLQEYILDKTFNIDSLAWRQEMLQELQARLAHEHSSHLQEPL